jgi:hypothetical protein
MGGESGVTTGFLLLAAVMAFLYLRLWDRTPCCTHTQVFLH